MMLSLNVLEHLGLNLYSNIPSVLAEAVANAWDADADAVEIEFDRENGRIAVKDDGAGMTREEVNERFLLVGYRRRDNQPGPTPKGRSPMGRKGIGKLSLFSVANRIEVHTTKNGERSALRMAVEEIRNKIQSGSQDYHPEPLSEDVVAFDRGTRIVLSDLRRRHTLRTSDALRRRLARRFAIIGPKYGFSVVVDGEAIVPTDRGYYDKLQYLWTYGDQDDVEESATNVEHREDRTDAVAGKKISVTGWLGTVSEVRHLKDEHGDNLNRIAIYVRGKMAQEDILDEIGERGVYASYIIGELRVDELDSYDGPETEPDDDAATSSRQHIVEDDPRYRRLLDDVIGDELKNVERKWSAWRTDSGSKKAMEIPAVAEWVEGLSGDQRKRAKRWLGRIYRIRTDEVEERKHLIKHAILAFEFYRCNENLERLDAIGDEGLPRVLEIFEDLDSLETNLYGQIVRQRIVVIRTLKEKVDENAKEKAIQEYIFDHLWLLDPAWERTEASELMETRVEKLFEEVDADLTDEERAGRIDIKYRHSAGSHIIVELKRPERRVSVYDLAKQIEKYRSGMQKLLDAQNRGNEPIYFVCLLGKKLTESDNPRGERIAQGTLDQLSARVVYYDQLLSNAYQAYSDYLNRAAAVGKLGGIIAAIDDYAAENGE
jgi:hypothetical protein